MDRIFDLCYVIVFCCGFVVMLGVFGWIFEFMCKHIPAFDTWVNNFIGCDEDDDEDWE